MASTLIQATVILIIIATISVSVYGLAAPFFGVLTPPLPEAPNFQILNLPNVSGDITGGVNVTWAYVQERNVTTSNGWASYDGFSPNRRVFLDSNLPTYDGHSFFTVGRAGNILGLFTAYGLAQLYDADMVALYKITVIDVIADWNATYNCSRYFADADENYRVQLSFYPIRQETTNVSAYAYSQAGMLNSWNVGHGFTVELATNSYDTPDWTNQTVSLLGLIGQTIIYCFSMLGYIVALGASMITLGGTVLPTSVMAILGGVVATIFALLIIQLIRGTSDAK